MMKLTRMALAAAALTALTGTAGAAEPSRSIRYADLNLASPQGRAATVAGVTRQRDTILASAKRGGMIQMSAR